MEQFLFTFGDVLWCDRTFDGEIIEDNHHIDGPFIVIEQNDDFVYVIKGSGCKDSEVAYGYDYVYNPPKNSNQQILRKTTVFKTSYIRKMEFKYIKKYIGRLDNTQINVLKRKMIINEIFMPGCNDALKNRLDVSYRCGDIISIDGILRYLVIDKLSQDEMLVIPYMDGVEKDKFVYQFDKQTTIPVKDESYKLVGTLTAERLQKLNNRRFQYEYGIKIDSGEKTIIKAGSVILSNDLLYYVSTIENDKYLCYSLTLANENNSTCMINGNYFLINFEQVKIDVKTPYTSIIYQLDENKMEEIRTLKKMDKIKSKNRIKSNNCSKKLKRARETNFYGKVLITKVYPLIRGAAFNTVNDYLEVVDLDKLKQGIFETHTYRLDDITFEDRQRGTFVNFINSLNVEISDPRYETFLHKNGIYDVNNYHDGYPRTRKTNDGN